MSEKDSDSTGTSQPKQVINGGGTDNGNDSNENKDHELARKRGRRTRDFTENVAYVEVLKN